MTILIALAFSAVMIGLIAWLKSFLELRSKATLPERRQRALAALAPAVNGQVNDPRVCGVWQGLPVEAGSEPGADLPHWKITLALPPGGADWRLVDVNTLGYMFQTGAHIGVEAPLFETSRKLASGSATREEIDASVDQTMAFREAHLPQLERGAALIARLGPLANAALTTIDSGFGYGVISYQAASGKLTYDAPNLDGNQCPNPQQFTDQLNMLFALRDAAAAAV